jgi:glutamate synthase domain-containing protein 3
MVELESVWRSEDVDRLFDLVSRHHAWTGSRRARHVLDHWQEMLGIFVKVVPIDYRKSLERLRQQERRQTDTTPATEEVFHA